MDWQELSQLAADPLVTIGAHTVNHLMLAKLSDKAARSEIDLSRSIIEAGLGKRPAAFVVSLRRCDLRGAARICARRRAWL